MLVAFTTALARDARAVARWVALGAGAGAVCGAVIGGLGGRLAMLVLRATSPDARGLTSDAGFEIGRFTAGGTLSLVAFAAVAGAFGGLAYVAIRSALPAAARIPAAALVGATLGGSAFLEPDGIDLFVLEPLWLAVAAFVGLPAVAAGATAHLVERIGARRGPLALRARVPSAAAIGARAAGTASVLALVAVQGAGLIDEVATIL